jgi:TetR/AcrR family transcriptional regulator, cholesterol catabolism regulator
MPSTAAARKRVATQKKNTKDEFVAPDARGRDSRWARKFREIVEHATAVFYEKGYEGASMRELSRVSGMSLAGLYYYFESKEKLLYLIQQHTFRTVMAQARERLRFVTDPDQRVRVFVENHLEYFLGNMQAMKVLSHEADVLRNGFGEDIQEIKREYYKLCRGLLQELRRSKGVVGARAADNGDLRVSVLSLFGMMNWIYTWYNPSVDGDWKKIAEQMSSIFLSGVMGCIARPTARKASKV